MRRPILVLALVIAPLAAAGTKAPESPKAAQSQGAAAGDTHENGEARWSSRISSNLSDVCRLTGLDRAIELGEEAGRSPRGGHDCVASSVWVHNLSPRPIYCRAVIKLRKPDDSGRKEISGQDFVLPGDTRSLATAYGREKRAPARADTKCEVRPDTFLPPSPPCDLQILSVPDPNLYYPEPSRRRDEEGEVTLDFRVDMSARKARDIRVSESSGFPQLDFAALRLGRKIVATATCPGVRGTVKVNFQIPAAPSAN